MNTNTEQPDDKKKKLLMLTADLFLQNTVRRFKAAIKEHPAGFTFNIINLQLKTNFSSKIYLVGQREHGKSFQTAPKHRELMAWLCANLSAIYRRGGLIGGWWNTEGVFFIDVVLSIDGRENAMSSGWINGEEAIYHPYSNRSIEVNTPEIDIYLSGD